MKDNVIIYKSDVCGTGKSFQIKRNIEEKNKLYFYLPLGGVLNRKDIYLKLKNIMKKINKKIEYKNNNYDKVCIHLDLYETEEHSIMNDFLFSFLVTRFYCSNENVIYIPREIKIYVEIPNCFSYYFIDNYQILNYFKSVDINLNKQSPLILTDKEKKILQENDIEKFFNDNINIINPSFYHKKIFISSLLNQIY